METTTDYTDFPLISFTLHVLNNIKGTKKKSRCKKTSSNIPYLQQNNQRLERFNTIRT